MWGVGSFTNGRDETSLSNRPRGRKQAGGHASPRRPTVELGGSYRRSIRKGGEWRPWSQRNGDRTTRGPEVRDRWDGGWTGTRKNTWVHGEIKLHSMPRQGGGMCQYVRAQITGDDRGPQRGTRGSMLPIAGWTGRQPSCQSYTVQRNEKRQRR